MANADENTHDGPGGTSAVPTPPSSCVPSLERTGMHLEVRRIRYIYIREKHLREKPVEQLGAGHVSADSTADLSPEVTSI